LLVRYHAASKQIFAKWVGDKPHDSKETKSSTVKLTTSDLWTPQRCHALVAELSNLQSAIARGSRELRIEQYYEQKSLVKPADRAVGPPPEFKRFDAGERVFHAVFGEGTVESESENYIFVKFDEDKFERKFLPAHSAEFVKV
jgi:hypothetical protein